MSQKSPATRLWSMFPVMFPVTFPTTLSNPLWVTLLGSIRRTAQATLLAVGLVVGLTACASNSITKQTASHQIISANAAVSQSIVNDARTFAPLELRAAERKLEQARISIEGKDYYMAQILGEQAEIDAQFAEAKAQSTKAQNIVEQLQENNRILQEEITRASDLDAVTKTNNEP